MHYIRILKPPRLTPSPRLNISAKITVTTDLGESFLSANISLVGELVSEDGTSLLASGKLREFLWRGREGMRSLEIAIPVPASKGKRKVDGEKVRLLVRPKEEEYAVDTFGSVLSQESKNKASEDVGGVVAVRSMAIDISPAAEKATGVGLAERVFSMGTGSDQRLVRIWEETGESIARHIWDAGLVLSSYLATISSHISPNLPSSTDPASKFPDLQMLKKILEKNHLSVLELGAGCGIVGITLATSNPQISKVLLTDLPEATEILTKNLLPLPLPISSKITHQVLDWASPLPDTTKTTKWDLVIVADCTYNPDVVPDLVQTLLHLAEINQEAFILLAMKVRHESEMVFFDLMTDAGFEVLERGNISLPVLGGEEQEIEIFGFGVVDDGARVLDVD